MRGKDLDFSTHRPTFAPKSPNRLTVKGVNVVGPVLLVVKVDKKSRALYSEGMGLSRVGRAEPGKVEGSARRGRAGRSDQPGSCAGKFS